MKRNSCPYFDRWNFEEIDVVPEKNNHEPHLERWIFDDVENTPICEVDDKRTNCNGRSGTYMSCPKYIDA